jgi:cysteinyl-tRNA synthetase
MHNEMLQVEGKKMSKSLGNFFTVRDLLEQGVPGEVIRFVMLSTHYRKPMDWTVEKKISAEFKLHGFLEAIAKYADLELAKKLRPHPVVIEALADDLNTHAALETVSKMDGTADANNLARNLVFLGIFSWDQLERHVQERQLADKRLIEIAKRFDQLRETAKVNKDFTAVDAMKEQLERANISVRTGKEGTHLAPHVDFDPGDLEKFL